MTILLKFGEEKLIDKEYMILQPDVTEAEFWEYANEDTNCELIDGVLIIHSPASEEHESIFKYLLTFFNIYLEKTGKGRVYGSRFVMRLSPKWNPEPDLMIILPKNYSQIQKNVVEGPADIVIEILSKATKEIDLTKKLPKFLDSGVQEVWIIDPEEKLLSIHTPSEKRIYSDPQSEDFIESPTLGTLPLKIKWIWNRAQLKIKRIRKKIL
ncbi:MAG: Uma2 family endonuclease [Candidatus Helarchaeota archaeon]